VGISPRIDLQAQRADRSEQELAKAERMIDLQGNVLAEQQRQIGQITKLDRRMRELTRDINQSAATQAAAIEELKRYDQAVAGYLRNPAPAAARNNRSPSLPYADRSARWWRAGYRAGRHRRRMRIGSERWMGSRPSC
jgi:hypothetical protein